jgi:hypothetical protein
MDMLIWLRDREEFERNFPEKEFPEDDGRVTIKVDHSFSQE